MMLLRIVLELEPFRNTFEADFASGSFRHRCSFPPKEIFKRTLRPGRHSS
jgi:hypothetical protein